MIPKDQKNKTTRRPVTNVSIAAFLSIWYYKNTLQTYTAEGRFIRTSLYFNITHIAGLR